MQEGSGGKGTTVSQACQSDPVSGTHMVEEGTNPQSCSLMYTLHTPLDVKQERLCCKNPHCQPFCTWFSGSPRVPTLPVFLWDSVMRCSHHHFLSLISQFTAGTNEAFCPPHPSLHILRFPLLATYNNTLPGQADTFLSPSTQEAEAGES